MRNLYRVVLIFLLQFFCAVPICHAGVTFHKPAYHGKIIDHETKEPLEGVAVVALYRTTDYFIRPATKRIGAQETLTDENGMFTIPSYKAFVSPLARAVDTSFIIFKPGYSSVPEMRFSKVYPLANCSTLKPFYFAPKCSLDSILRQKIGSKQEVIINLRTGEKTTINNGIVELVKLETIEEQIRASLFSVPDFNLPILKRIMAENKAERRKVVTVEVGSVPPTAKAALAPQANAPRMKPLATGPIVKSAVVGEKKEQ